jgi:hypothetical protein
MRLKSPKKSKLGPSPSLKHEVRRHSKGRRASTCIIGDETARHTKLHFRKFCEVTPRWTERNFQICLGFTDRSTFNVCHGLESHPQALCGPISLSCLPLLQNQPSRNCTCLALCPEWCQGHTNNHRKTGMVKYLDSLRWLYASGRMLFTYSRSCNLGPRGEVTGEFGQFWAAS